MSCTTADRRWPEFVYGAGTEPDYRYSLANERTFLAWIRTAVALLAAGVAVDVVDMSLGRAQPLLASLLVLSGLAIPPAAWVRWARSERAMRRRKPLPAFGSAAAVAMTVALAALTTVVGMWGDG